MSSYITRWCPRHGEWDDDVDCPSECPECLKLGIAESQLNFKKITESTARIAELEAENAKLRSALLPFCHDELCRELGGNTEGDESPVFLRGHMEEPLRLKHFRAARAARAEVDNG